LKAFINRKTLISAGFAKNPKKRKKEKRINTKEAAKNNKELFSFFLFCEPGNFTLGKIVESALLSNALSAYFTYFKNPSFARRRSSTPPDLLVNGADIYLLRIYLNKYFAEINWLADR